MRLLDLLLFSENQPSEDPTLIDEERFSEPPLKLFSTPSTARMAVQQGSPSLVKFAGTFWRFQVNESRPCTFVDGQAVKVVGRQGNRLLIELEISND